MELSYEETRRRVNPKNIQCKTTDELEPLGQIIGQDRAVKALEFGLKIQKKGFNVYVAGQRGTGKRTGIELFLKEIAKMKSAPPDWCYV
ncbi:MAG: AAA family ATPase, partial [Candidatus Thorarchaeota archaeon]